MGWNFLVRLGGGGRWRRGDCGSLQTCVPQASDLSLPSSLPLCLNGIPPPPSPPVLPPVPPSLRRSLSLRQVQLQVLVATVKVFLKYPDTNDALLQSVLRMCAEESDNPAPGPRPPVPAPSPLQQGNGLARRRAGCHHPRPHGRPFQKPRGPSPGAGGALDTPLPAIPSHTEVWGGGTGWGFQPPHQPRTEGLHPGPFWKPTAPPPQEQLRHARDVPCLRTPSSLIRSTGFVGGGGD